MSSQFPIDDDDEYSDGLRLIWMITGMGYFNNFQMLN